MIKQMTESLYVEQVGGELIIQCKKCKHAICSVTENYKNHVVIGEYPLTRAGPKRSASGEFLLREFYCPNCGLMLDVEEITKGSPIIWDVKLKELI
jgi:acetone carboxylase gamma subunit